MDIRKTIEEKCNIVIESMGEGIVVCAQQFQHCPRENKHQSPNQHPAEDCTVKAEGTDMPHTPKVFLSEQTGDQRGAALTEDIAECHQQCEDGCTERNTCHQVGIAGCGDKISICQIVDHRDDHAEDQRQGQLEKRLVDRRIFKEFIFHSKASFL